MHYPPILPTLLSIVLCAGSVAIASDAEENRVAYLPLSDKGISGEEVIKRTSGFKPTRSRPAVRYLSPEELPHRDREGSAAHESVSVKLIERSGHEQRGAWISFGLPFPQGALYRLDSLCASEEGEQERQEIPVQAHALALWPDGSVKSALIQLVRDLKADETRTLLIEYGREVKPKAEVAQRITVNQGKAGWIVNTGKLEVSLSPSRFAPPGNVTLLTPTRLSAASGAGLRLEDEHGRVFSSAEGPLDSLTLERAGALEAVVRAEGAFASATGGKLMRHITRLRFMAGSSRVEATVTVVNDALAREFTDIRSLDLELAFPGAKEWKATFSGRTAPASSSASIALTQWDENRLSLQDGEAAPEEAAGRSEGTATVNTEYASMRFGFKDFWQRWPKGLAAKPGRFTLSLLPKQIHPLEQQLPVHLQFPFVEGCYRTKWGTAFTERMVFEFAQAERGLSSVEATSGAIQTPPLVVIPPSYLAKTEVFAPIPVQQSERLSRWHSYFGAAMEHFVAHRDRERTYGYLNWGDWFGERGRNWGNNEYDIPHSLFTQYLLTGEGRLLDAAVAGVRHQADVDIVHAYPDAYYIGANLQHGIGHSGISYQKVIPKTWTYLYDYATSAGNGHTWADGMADCWLLTGDPVVMESLLALGEHIRWAFAPSFTNMGNHHRSAGWSSQAAAATYRATSDPEYLAGLKMIINLPLEARDKKSGIWPVELHPGHAGGKKGLVGASVYNLGVLMMGIAKYHSYTGDPRALEALDGASAWLLKCWSEERAWPYAALTDGSLLRKSLSPNLNPLVYPALAYTGKQTGKQEYSLVAAKALDVTFLTPKEELLPKEFSIKAYATPWAISLLENRE